MSYSIDEGVHDAGQRHESLKALQQDHPRAYQTQFMDLDVWMSPDLGREQATNVFWPNEQLGLYKSTEAYTVWPQDFRPIYLTLVMHEMQQRDPDLYQRVVQFVKQFG